MAQQKTNPITFIILLGLMFLVVFGLYKGCQSCSSTNENELLVEIEIGSEGIKIMPKENYTEVNIKLNDDYKANLSYLISYSEKTIPYADFSKSSGQQFSILSTKPKSVYISGYKNGEKYWGYFKNN